MGFWHSLKSKSFNRSPPRYLLWEDPDPYTVKSISKLKSIITGKALSGEPHFQRTHSRVSIFTTVNSFLNPHVLICVYSDVD